MSRVLAGALLPLFAFALQWPFWFVLNPLAWFLFFPAVFLGSWIGNRASGICASLLSVALVWWFFLPPQFELVKPLNAWLSSGVFLAMGIMFSTVHERLRRANRSTTVALRAARDALGELEASQKQLRQAATAFQSTNEAIMVTDEQRRLVAVNRAFETITGYCSADVLGSNPRFLQSGRQDRDFYEHMWAVLHRTGQWQGEIWDRRRSGEIFPAWENISAIRDGNGRVTHYVSVLSDISAIKQAEERLAHLAHHDALTGLPNRLRLEATIEDAVEHADRRHQRFAVLFLDLDRFKLVNDTLGHPVGDQLLKVVAERLRGCVRAEDMVARLGGDEFVVVLSEVSDTDSISRIATKIVAGMRDPVQFDNRELDVSTSVGISVFPDDGRNAGDLLKAADTALYRAKERGRDTYEFYTAEMTRRALERVSLEARLRRAIGRGELSLHYQPQIASATGVLSGVEVLLRWDDPVEGMISPGRFIPVAEESGLIDTLGAWVIEHAFAQVRIWLDAGLQPGRIAINLSGRQILYGQVVAAVRRALANHRLDAGSVCIELEVTESVLQSMERSLEVLRELRALGMQVAIDDFGTGYSSLGMLKHLPINALKIDQTFVRGIPADSDSVAITRAIVAMAHNLGLRVVAEGVERREQFELLRDVGCDEVQGFLLGRPVSADALTALLTRATAAEPAS